MRVCLCSGVLYECWYTVCSHGPVDRLMGCGSPMWVGVRVHSSRAVCWMECVWRYVLFHIVRVLCAHTPIWQAHYSMHEQVHV